MTTTTPGDGVIDDAWCEHHFDHLSPDLADNLHPTLAYMRENHPVAHSDERGGFWLVTKHADVVAVAQDWATFSSAHGITVPIAPHLDSGPARTGRPAVAPGVQAAHQRVLHPGRGG